MLERKFLLKRATLLAAILVLSLTTYLVHLSHCQYSSASESTKQPNLEVLQWKPNAPPRIAIAAISTVNTNTRSLALWSAYASRFGHDLYVQRTPVVRGFVNSFVWLQHVIAIELMKDFPTDERAEWIVFANPAAAIPSNPSLPLTHFLPPPSFPSASTLTFIGTKSPSNEINTSLFYIRVSSLSLLILMLAMSAVYLDPQRDWGNDVTASTLRDVLEREGYKDKVLWVPGQWWDEKDAVILKPHVSEGGRGLVEMEKVLEDAEEGFRVRGKEMYPSKEEVGTFWNLVGEARLVLDAAKEKGNQDGEEEVGQEMWLN